MRSRASSDKLKMEKNGIVERESELEVRGSSEDAEDGR